MTVAELSLYLSKLPVECRDMKVLINGWGSDEGLGPYEGAFEVTGHWISDYGFCLGHDPYEFGG